jgi:hypothetical protein
VRWLLVLLLVTSVVPDVAFAVEAAAHEVVDRVTGRTQPDPEDGGQDAPHECPARHACVGSCGHIGTPQDAVSLVRAASQDLGGVAPSMSGPATREPSRPFRPPIG